jgi:NADH:ubiquinone oxidoreductase subunit 5 (subunit L)/multisubunit Na+/H+ antiporter MnhA subunit
MLIIATFSIPILGSFLTLVADRISSTFRNVLAVLIMIATFGCALALIPMAGQAGILSLGSSIVPGLEFNFIADGLGVYVAAMSSLVGMLILCYSIGYMKEYAHQGEFYFMVVLFLGAMMGLVLSANLLLMYIFWEITAICSWRLIGFYRDPQHLRNADTALMITVFGSFLMLIGFEMTWHELGSLNISALQGHEISGLAIFLISMGILAKSAQAPLQIWLPGAGVAPSPVTALLHAAVLVVIGVFAYARIFIGVFSLSPAWQNTMAIIAIVTILIAGAAALVENNAKRILAYSTLGQLAYIFLGFASMTSIGIAGGLVFLLAHSFAKAGLFLCVGIIEHKTHTKDIRELGGLIRSMPATAIAFALCALTIVGFPPTAGFFGKLMIIMGTLESGKVILAALAVLGALLSLAYMIRLFNALFLGEKRWRGLKEGTPGMVMIVVAFAALSLLVGLAASPLMNIVNAFVTQMTG